MYSICLVVLWCSVVAKTLTIILEYFPTVGRGPKTVKLFTNQPHTLDFDQAEQQRPVQELVLIPTDLFEDSVVGLNYVKYQNVQNLTVSEVVVWFHSY